MEALSTRRNAAKLCVTRSELHTLTPVLQAVQGHAEGCGAADNVLTLSGCFVRVKRRTVYRLERIVACRIQAAEDGGPEVQLMLEGSDAPVSGHSISDSNPFLPGDDAAYERSGRAELLALRAALAEAPGPPGCAAAGPARMDLGAAAGAAWRKKVVLGWAPHLPELLQTRGISKLLADLSDPARLAEQAASMDQPQTSALPHSPTGAGVLGSPVCSPRYSLRQGPAPWHQQAQMQQSGSLVSQESRRHEPASPQLQRQAQREQQELVPPPPPQQQQQQHQDGPLAVAAVTRPMRHSEQPPSLPPPAPPPPPDQRQQNEQAAPASVQHEPPVQQNAAFWATLRKVKAKVGSQQQPAPAQQQQQGAAGHAQPAEQAAAAPQAVPQPELPPPPQPPQQSAALGPHSQQAAAKPHALLHQAVQAQERVQGAPLQQETALQQEVSQQQQPPDQAPPVQEEAPPHQDELVARLQRKLLAQLERQQSEQLSPAQQQSTDLQAQQQLHPEHPLQQPAQQPGAPAGPPSGPLFRLTVCGLDNRMSGQQLEAYFRARYASVISATVPGSDRSAGGAFVCFSSRDERDRAVREMSGHVLPGGRKITTGLPAGDSVPGASPAGPSSPSAGAAPGQPAAAEGSASAQAGPASQQVASMAGGVGSPRSTCNQPPAAKPQLAAQRVRSPRAPGKAAAVTASARHPAGEARQTAKSQPLQPPPPPPLTAAAGPVQAQAQTQAQLQLHAQLQLQAQAQMQAQQMQFLAARQLGGVFQAAAAAPHLMQRILSFPPAGPRHPDPFFMRQNSAPLVNPGPFGMAAGWTGPLAARPPPFANPALRHLGSGNSTHEFEHRLESSPSDHSGAAPPQRRGRSSGAGESEVHGRGRSRSRSCSRSRSRSPGRSGGARRGSPGRRPRSRSRSGGKRSHDGGRRRSRSRSPRRQSSGRPGTRSRSHSCSRSPRRLRLGVTPRAEPLPLPGPTSLPLWLPPMLRTACQAVAFSRKQPFPAGLLLPALDELRGERDCLRGTGLSLRHLCDFLKASGLADIDFRPDGPWVGRVRPG